MMTNMLFIELMQKVAVSLYHREFIPPTGIHPMRPCRLNLPQSLSPPDDQQTGDTEQGEADASVAENVEL